MLSSQFVLQWHLMNSTRWTSGLEFQCKSTIFASITPDEIPWDSKTSFLNSLISSRFITTSLSVSHHFYMRNLHVRTHVSFVWWRNDKETVNLDTMQISLSLSLSLSLSQSIELLAERSMLECNFPRINLFNFQRYYKEMWIDVLLVSPSLSLSPLLFVVTFFLNSPTSSKVLFNDSFFCLLDISNPW